MEIQKILGYLLNTSARYIKRRMDEDLQKFDITTSQWSVLKLLHTKGELTQAQIAEELMSDRATAGSIIFKLCEKKYIEKIVDSKDRRSYIVRLTSQSVGIVEEIEAMATRVTDEALSGIKDEEKDILYNSLRQIIDNLAGGKEDEF